MKRAAYSGQFTKDPGALRIEMGTVPVRFGFGSKWFRPPGGADFAGLVLAEEPVLTGWSFSANRTCYQNRFRTGSG